MKIRAFCLKACLLVFLVTIASGCNRGGESVEKSQVVAPQPAPRAVALPPSGERAAVSTVNTPPRILELPFTPVDFYQGVDITVTPQAVDADGDPVSFDFTWFINDEELLGEKGETLSGHRFRRGDRIALQVTPYDGKDYGKTFESKAVVVPNAAPDIVSTPPVNFKSRVYQYQVKAEDVDGDALSYSLETAPAGMVINKTTGEVVWPIGANQSGEHKVKIVVADEKQSQAFQEYSITITLTE